MSRKPTKKPKQSKTQLVELNNSLKQHINNEIVNNGLAGAVFGMGVPAQGYGFGGPNTSTVSQPTQIFNDLRWYFVSNFRQMLSEAYVELGLIQTLVNLPVDDGLRGGVEIRSKTLTPDQIAALKDALDRFDDIGKVGQALKWNRLFGGAGVLILTDQDPTLPLNMKAVTPNTPLEFRAVDMWELYFDLQNSEGYDPAIQDERYEYFSYYGTKIHKSRVIIMKGLQAPSFLRPRLRGWGFSVVESVVRSINQYLLGTNLIYELADEAKIDVFKIKNLVSSLMAPQGAAQIATRIELANREKDYNHALVLDGEDDYAQKQLSFSGLAEIMKEIRLQVASDLRMPISKLFGVGSSGFSSGEDDIENYNAMIESTIRQQAKSDILRVIELRCLKLFGSVPPDLSIAFQPLRVLSLVDEEDVKGKQFDRLLASFQAGALSLNEFRLAMNHNDLAVIQLEPREDVEGADELGVVKGDQAESEETKEETEEEQSSLGSGEQPEVQEPDKE